MSDNTPLNTGIGGDTIRTIDRSGDSTPIAAKTQVTQLDIGGETNEALLIGTTQGVQPTLLVPTQDCKDSGRTMVCFYIDGTAGISTETLMTCSQNIGGAVTSATSYTIPTNTTLRITSLTATVKNTTTTAVDSRVRLRYVTTGTVATTSGIIAAMDLPGVAAATTTGTTVNMPFPDGVEVYTGQIAISQSASSTVCTISVCVTGFLY